MFSIEITFWSHINIWRRYNKVSFADVFSGSTSDWAYEKAGIPLSYTIEVRDTGTFRFELPEYEIIPTSEEVMAGIQYISEYIIETYSPDETISSQEPKAWHQRIIYLIMSLLDLLHLATYCTALLQRVLLCDNQAIQAMLVITFEINCCVWQYHSSIWEM